MGGRGSSRERHFREDCASAFEIALDFSLTRASIRTSFERPVFDGGEGFRQVWNLDQWLLLKSGWSRGWGSMIDIACHYSYTIRAQC